MLPTQLITPSSPPQSSQQTIDNLLQDLHPLCRESPNDRQYPLKYILMMIRQSGQFDPVMWQQLIKGLSKYHQADYGDGRGQMFLGRRELLEIVRVPDISVYSKEDTRVLSGILLGDKKQVATADLDPSANKQHRKQTITEQDIMKLILASNIFKSN